jgi:hypothetical protein
VAVAVGSAGGAWAARPGRLAWFPPAADIESGRGQARPGPSHTTPACGSAPAVRSAFPDTAVGFGESFQAHGLVPVGAGGPRTPAGRSRVGASPRQDGVAPSSTRNPTLSLVFVAIRLPGGTRPVHIVRTRRPPPSAGSGSLLVGGRPQPECSSFVKAAADRPDTGRRSDGFAVGQALGPWSHYAYGASDHREQSTLLGAVRTVLGP